MRSRRGGRFLRQPCRVRRERLLTNQRFGPGQLPAAETAHRSQPPVGKAPIGGAGGGSLRVGAGMGPVRANGQDQTRPPSVAVRRMAAATGPTVIHAAMWQGWCRSDAQRPSESGRLGDFGVAAEADARGLEDIRATSRNGLEWCGAKRGVRLLSASRVLELGDDRMAVRSVRLSECFEAVQDTWNPRIVAEVNETHVKVVKLQGEFLWHHHDDEDELFWVHKGALTIRLPDGDVVLHAGELLVVPRGMEHLPVAAEEVEVVLIEPATTLNTGNVVNERTVRHLEHWQGE